MGLSQFCTTYMTTSSKLFFKLIADIINKMLSRQPSDRYQSVTEVEKALAILPRVKSQQLLTTNQQLNNFSASQEATVGANLNKILALIMAFNIYDVVNPRLRLVPSQ